MNTEQTSENIFTYTYFNVIAVSESRLIKDKLSLIEVSVLKYSYEFCSTGASGGGNLIFISNHLSYETRNNKDL